MSQEGLTRQAPPASSSQGTRRYGPTLNPRTALAVTEVAACSVANHFLAASHRQNPQSRRLRYVIRA